MIFGPDDLVGRLRTEVTHVWASPLGELLNEAADVIERLRAMPCPYVRQADGGTAYCSLNGPT